MLIRVLRVAQSGGDCESEKAEEMADKGGEKEWRGGTGGGGDEEEIVISGGGEGDISARDGAGGSMPAGVAQAPKPAQASTATPVLSIGPPVTVGSKRKAGDAGVDALASSNLDPNANPKVGNPPPRLLGGGGQLAACVGARDMLLLGSEHDAPAKLLLGRDGRHLAVV